ncbi:hypothetical protein C2G38_2154750 [Gigaspora rosea]|uniref:Uncharacterized protein n=1 Tax=Gigaspora rosea TaxID=44941 RepID=A0A397W6F0_9GLOM|nr:hypothetical protein C2G38_2154750 [Gigaspora rosea]
MRMKVVLRMKNFFKCTVAIDIIYGIRHQKYVFAINLALLAIKYSIAKSKTIVDIDSRLITAAEACEEKKKNINIIDNLANIKTDAQKQYHEYGKNKIENSKCKCPQCNAKLPTLAETQHATKQATPEKKI